MTQAPTEGPISARVAARLAAIAEREPVLRAYAHLDPDAALAAARALDGRDDPGPLGGAVVAIKDIFDTADMPTCCGSPIHAGRRPGRDAAAVAAIRAAGGVIVGKSVTTEFAYMNPGPTTHPLNSAHTPGGSSSGSAASVAAGGADFATGTQTAGSIIRPAAFCGVAGFKPSRGLVSRSGLALFSETLDTIGGFARDVAGVARLVGAMAGRRDLIALAPAPVAPRVGVVRGAEWGLATPEAHAALESAAARFARAGASVRDVDLPEPCRGLLPVQQAVMAHEGARALAWEAAAAWDSLSAPLQALIEEGRGVDARDHAAHMRRTVRARAAMAGFFEDVDVALTLSAPGEAPEGLASTGDSSFNRVWTLLGGPALNLPAGTGPSGLPLGVQLVGPVWRDAETAAFALWAEAVLAEA